MTLAELKRRLPVGTMLRKRRGPPLTYRHDRLLVVVKADSVGVYFEGEGVPAGKGPSFLPWPKAKGFKETGFGFLVYPRMTVGHELEYDWYDPDKPTPKDIACVFLLNTLEKIQDAAGTPEEADADAILTLGDRLENHAAATAVIDGWRKLPGDLQAAFMGRPEPCDRSVRLWLDCVWDWGDVPREVDV